MAGRGPLPSDMKAVPLVESHVAFAVGVEIAGMAVAIGLCEVRFEQAAAKSLSLTVGLDTE